MDVTAEQTTMTNVMDLYYSWLLQLLKPKGRDKIALLGTIVTHDVLAGSPLYTNYIYRQFADRTISVSPEDFGAGNTNDRYSRIYRQIIAVAASDLYANVQIPADKQVRLDQYTADITSAINEIRAVRRELQSEWNDSAEKGGFKPGTPAYDLERAKFYQPSLSLIEDQRGKIVVAQANKKSVMMSLFAGDKAAQQLAGIYERTIAADNQQALPSDSQLEVTYKLDPITIGAAADSGMFAFETELGLLPSGNLTKILGMKGSRSASFIKDEKETHNHDSEWHAHAKGGWGLWSGSGDATQESHFRQSLEHLENISIDCDFMGEYWVSRRDWFSSNVLTNKYVVDVLKDDPRAAALLSNCISSMIIVRGLKVTYKFKDVADLTVWSSYNYKAGGGYGVFGIDFGSVSGGASGNSYDHTINTTDNSVTFYDGEDVCRLLALRVSTVLDEDPAKVPLYSGHLDRSQLGRLLISAWQDGKAPYGHTFAELFASAGEGLALEELSVAEGEDGVTVLTPSDSGKEE